ncbi:MAG: hypothetical protein JBO36_05025 [Candidatus Thiodiazotropha taylori]|nr:hypothetical protein [Candidatus Thiodiazotropha taylori]
MDYRLISLVLLLLAIITWMVMPPEPTVIVVDLSKVPEKQSDIYKDLNQNAPDIADIVEPITEGIEDKDGLDQDEIETIKTKLKKQLDAFIGKLDKHIDSIKSSDRDSPEFTHWQNRYRECLIGLRDSASKIDISKQSAHDEIQDLLVKHGEKPCDDIVQDAEDLPDPDDRKKAKKQADSFQQILGKFLMLLSVYYAMTGDFHTAYKLYVLGNTLLKKGDGGDDGEDGTGAGGGDQQQTTAPEPREEKRPLPEEVAEDFDSYGGDGGKFSFLLSKDSKQWRLIKFDDNGSIETLHDVSLSETKNAPILSREMLRTCTLEVGDPDSELQMKGQEPCADFTLNLIDGSWVYFSNKEVQE